MAGGGYSEKYERGSAEAERIAFERYVQDILKAQKKWQRAARAPQVQRAFHAKSVLSTARAELRFADHLPPELQTDYAQPGAVYPVLVRLSNANGAAQADHAQDLRGIAVRLDLKGGRQHDLLATNFPVSHARNARQFVRFALATAGTGLQRVFGLAGLAFELGPLEVIRMLRNVQAGRKREVASLALETYWSRGAVTWGEALAVRYLFRPSADAAAAAPIPAGVADHLRRDIAARLGTGDVSLDLCLQRFVDESKTPIEDGAIEWRPDVAPAEPVARLTLFAHDVEALEAQAQAREIDELAFNPWNAPAAFRPLGNLNRARKVAYDASAAHRLGHRWLAEPPLRNRIFSGLLLGLFKVLNRWREWHRLPLKLSLLNLDMIRVVLRRRSLIDTEVREAPPMTRAAPQPLPEAVRLARTYDGSYNDLSDPTMGAIGATFGRNMAPVYKPPLFDDPPAYDVAESLLKRDAFIPARSLNLLAAAWIQFQVHDWVNHARHPLGSANDVVVPLPEGVSWVNERGGKPEPHMRIAGNVNLGSGPGGAPVYFGNTASHWWDGSEVYGPDAGSANMLREQINGTPGAKLNLVDGYLPTNCKGQEVTGFNESWWLGLSAMHTLFAREHNAVCDALRAEYPYLDDERVYQTARLVVSALIAKIHTVEWTPAILATKAIDIALNTNWNGPPADDWVTKLGLWAVDEHALKGIPQTLPDHHTAPYSLTEDFVMVYRMHPLIPDDYRFLNHSDGALLATKTFDEIQGAAADDMLRKMRLSNVLYSFGVAHPGAITLNNYPNALRKFGRDNEIIDMAVLDLVRSRRRGVPRYNDFRAGVQKPRIKRFEELTQDPETLRRLKAVYRNDVDLIDTMVGLFAETAPEGFGFSDTAFRIFILMASRRLQSDRFLTVDFRPEFYTPLGIDWVQCNGMTSVILRNSPDLAALLPRGASAFAPWRRVGAG